MRLAILAMPTTLTGAAAGDDGDLGSAPLLQLGQIRVSAGLDDLCRVALTALLDTARPALGRASDWVRLAQVPGAPTRRIAASASLPLCRSSGCRPRSITAKLLSARAAEAQQRPITAAWVAAGSTLRAAPDGRGPAGPKPLWNPVDPLAWVGCWSRNCRSSFSTAGAAGPAGWGTLGSRPSPLRSARVGLNLLAAARVGELPQAGERALYDHAVDGLLDRLAHGELRGLVAGVADLGLEQVVGAEDLEHAACSSTE